MPQEFTLKDWLLYLVARIATHEAMLLSYDGKPLYASDRDATVTFINKNRQRLLDLVPGNPDEAALIQNEVRNLLEWLTKLESDLSHLEVKGEPADSRLKVTARKLRRLKEKLKDPELTTKTLKKLEKIPPIDTRVTLTASHPDMQRVLKLKRERDKARRSSFGSQDFKDVPG